MDASRFDNLTRRFAERLTRRQALGTALAGVALARAGSTAAQDSTPAPAASPVADGEKPVFMFVQTFASGRGDVNPGAGTPAAGATPVPGGGAPYLLTLDGHTGLTVYFSDRPDRVVGAVPTGGFLDTLGFGAHNPPNAALVGEFKAGQGVVVLKLLEPSYDEATETLTYGAEVLDAYQGGNLDPVTHEQIAERLPAEFGPAALFIDDCPDVDTCMKPIPLGWWSVGPIPGGPYGACWQGLLDGCELCHTTEDHLKALCNEAYPDECKGRCDVSA